MPVFYLTEELAFPPPRLASPPGLLAFGGDLSVERLLLAYRTGVFPWYSDGEPILWWSPDPRFVLLPSEFHLPRRLERTLRQRRFHITLDEAFDAVIRNCATAPRPGQDGTWITLEMEQAYRRLHRAGYGHSVECWMDGELAGGLYGVSLGAYFSGESMFSRRADASKVALAALVTLARAWDFVLIDCQVPTPHLERLGAREIRRSRFLELLKAGLARDTRRGKWRFPGPLP